MLYFLKNKSEQTFHDRSWISCPKEGKGYSRDDDSVIGPKFSAFHRANENETRKETFRLFIVRNEKETKSVNGDQERDRERDQFVWLLERKIVLFEKRLKRLEIGMSYQYWRDVSLIRKHFMTETWLLWKCPCEGRDIRQYIMEVCARTILLIGLGLI